MVQAHDGIIDIITYLEDGAMKNVDVSSRKLSIDTDYELLEKICAP